MTKSDEQTMRTNKRKEMHKLNLDTRYLKKFGITMGIAFLVITILVSIKGMHNVFPTLLVSIVFFLAAFIKPTLLKPIYSSWMKLSRLLGLITTSIILFMLFYLIVTPMGFAIRLFGLVSLDRKIETQKLSYWRKKDERHFDRLNYEKQF